MKELQDMTNGAVDSTRDISGTVSFGSNVWSDSLLGKMRQPGAPSADGVIAKPFADSEVDQVNALMMTLGSLMSIRTQPIQPRSAR
jgi:hypothetical protein